MTSANISMIQKRNDRSGWQRERQIHIKETVWP
jgi:hypothetical protein